MDALLDGAEAGALQAAAAAWGDRSDQGSAATSAGNQDSIQGGLSHDGLFFEADTKGDAFLARSNSDSSLGSASDADIED